MYTARRLRRRGSGAFLASVRTGLVTAVCAMSFVSVLPSPLSPQEAVSPLAEALSNRLAAPGVGFSMAPALRFESELHRFYGERGYAPVWLSPTNRAGRIDELLAAFRSADLDGLRSDEYGAADVAWMFTSPGPLSPTALAEVELYLSDAFLRLAHDLSRGRVDPLGLVGEWSGAREPFDAVAVLKRASLPSSASSALDALRPSHPQYGALRDALAFLRGGEDWVRVPSGETLKVGDVDGRVVSVRERLVQSGDLATRGAPSADLALFDPVLEDAVRAFQRRHGFDADGLVGPETLSALNVPASERALQVAANMERWRWLPNDLGDRRVVVNVPDFSVTLEEGPDAMPVRLRAIVGRTDRETPTFSSTIESFSLAPYWNVPENLARQDILPSIRADTMYLDRAGMTVIDLRSGELVDGRSLDWAEISDDEFLARYRLRQEPGPANSLGDLRIAFPNPYTVFLHDTPARSLFEGSSRAFSSGCIRVERSFELLDWLLAGDPEWTQERITEALEAGEERSSRIREPVPIHVLYLTALVEEDGRLGFRPDVYGLDASLERALMSAADSDSPIAQPMIEPCS